MKVFLDEIEVWPEYRIVSEGDAYDEVEVSLTGKEIIEYDDARRAWTKVQNKLRAKHKQAEGRLG